MELEKVGTAIHFHPNLPSTRIYFQIYVPVDDDKHFFTVIRKTILLTVNVIPGRGFPTEP